VRGRGTAIQAGVAAAIIGAILLEGFGPIPHARVPPVPAGQAGARAPQLHLPSDYGHDLIYTYWSTAGFPDMVNGSGSFELNELLRTRNRVSGFPDAASVAYLNELGVRTVVLHRDLAAGTPWQVAARRSIEGLPLTREDRGTVILYHLRPKATQS
jgi:hypothetical protein